VEREEVEEREGEEWSMLRRVGGREGREEEEKRKKEGKESCAHHPSAGSQQPHE